MFRFALILLMSLALSSQAVAAVKWNNSGSGNNKVPQIVPEDEQLEFVHRDIYFGKKKLHRASVAGPDGALAVGDFKCENFMHF